MKSQQQIARELLTDLGTAFGRELNTPYANKRVLSAIERALDKEVHPHFTSAQPHHSDWKSDGPIVQFLDARNHIRSINVGSDYAAELLVKEHNRKSTIELRIGKNTNIAPTLSGSLISAGEVADMRERLKGIDEVEQPPATDDKERLDALEKCKHIALKGEVIKVFKFSPSNSQTLTVFEGLTIREVADDVLVKFRSNKVVPATDEKPQEWECPECKTRYISDVGRCGDLRGCSRPDVIPVAAPRGEQVHAKLDVHESMNKQDTKRLDWLQDASMGLPDFTSLDAILDQRSWTSLRDAIDAAMSQLPTKENPMKDHNAALADEREKHAKTKRQLGMVVDWRDQLAAVNAALAAERTKLRSLVDTLRFYADMENYVNDVIGLPDGTSEVEGSSAMNQDGGLIARHALEKVKEGE